MTRMQILLEKKEVSALNRYSHETGKSYSQLVREAIDNTYISEMSEIEIRKMAREAKNKKGQKKFKDADSFLKYLWSF